MKKRIILTGGIGCGKSTVASLFSMRGIQIIDTDKISKDIFQKNIDKIKEMFNIEDNDIDEIRKIVKKIIFNDKKKKFELETFMHPLILKDISYLEKIFIENKIKYLVDIPLYFETKIFSTPNDYIILVTAPYKIQLNRIMERDKITEDMAKRIIRSQLPSKIKEKKSDCIIINDGGKDELNNKVELCYKKIWGE